jgi:serine/threonine protein phosphatase PrpC
MSETGNQTAAKRAIPIIVGAESEIGRREENQDSMTGFPSPFGAVYMIADGMGGHRGGAEASRMVVEGIRTHLLQSPPEMSLQKAIENAARMTNRELFTKGKSGDPKYTGMGSTVTLVVIREGDSGAELITAHVGDSRVYLHRDSQLSPLTKDHTFVQRLVDSHTIDEETARTHPEASVLTRAMGQAPDVTIDVSEPILLFDGDGILLCSDGLSGYAPRAAIEETVTHHPGPDDCVKALVKLALKNGSDDNITVQFVRVGNPPDIPVPPPSAKRHTQPESEAFLPITQEQPAAKLPRSSRTSGKLMLWFALGLLVLVGAAGIYKFRPALFSFLKPPAEADPKSSMFGRIQDLHHKVALERDQVSRELVAVVPAKNEPLRKDLEKLVIQFNKLADDTDRLGLERGAKDDAQAKDRASVNSFFDQYSKNFGVLHGDHKKCVDKEKELKIAVAER